jgi:hypothetical protein
VYKIKNALIYLYLGSEENTNSHRYDVENCIKMDKAKIFVAHLATSCSTPVCRRAPFENLEGSSLGLIKVLSPYLLEGTGETHEKRQSG